MQTVSPKLVAYHGDPKIKQKYLRRVRAHREADELIKGAYWEGGKGCAVGCTVHSSSHEAYEQELGIPQVLAILEDSIFESLPNGKAKEWPEKFLSAIKPGADLGLVWPKFAIWLLTDKKLGVLQFARSNASRKAIQDVADAYGQVVAGKGSSTINWHNLRAAAVYAAEEATTAAIYAAENAAAATYASYASTAAAAAYASSAAVHVAEDAAEDAAEEAAENAAEEAAEEAATAAAAYAVDTAAYAAAASTAAYAAYAASAAATYAARIDARIAQSEKLLELLEASHA